MVTYTAEIRTGSRDDAGTNARVSITLYGSGGTADKELTPPSKEHKNPFEKGYIDSFDIPSNDLGQLHCINIRHDKSGHKPGWFLEEVKIKVDGKDVAYFPCSRWLSEGEDDKRTSRGLAEYRFYQPNK